MPADAPPPANYIPAAVTPICLRYIDATAHVDTQSQFRGATRAR